MIHIVIFFLRAYFVYIIIIQIISGKLYYFECPAGGARAQPVSGALKTKKKRHFRKQK